MSEEQPTQEPADLLRLDSIINSLTGQGGALDRGAASRPDTSGGRKLNDQELEALFRNSGVARRVVEGVVGHAVRKGWRVVGDGIDPDALSDVEEELGLIPKLAQALTWSRLYGGGGLFLVLDEKGNPKADTPIRLERVTRIRGLAVLGGIEATVAEWDDDVRSASFKEPKTFSVAPVGGLILRDGARGAGVGLFHASRLIHLIGAQLPPADERASAVRGQSVLQAAWDQLRNLAATEQGAATLATEFSIPVVNVANLASKSTGDGAADFEKRMQTLAKSRSLLGLILLAQGETFTRQAVSLAGWNDLVEQAKDMVCAVTGEPATILFGRAPSGLSTDDESGNRALKERVASFQDLVVKPSLRAFYRLLFASKNGPTKGVIPRKWRIEFNPLDEPTDDEQATTRKTVAETDAIYINLGVYTPEDVARSRFGAGGWKADMDTIEPMPEPEQDVGADPYPADPADPQATPRAPAE